LRGRPIHPVVLPAAAKNVRNAADGAGRLRRGFSAYPLQPLRQRRRHAQPRIDRRSETAAGYYIQKAAWQVPRLNGIALKVRRCKVSHRLYPIKDETDTHHRKSLPPRSVIGTANRGRCCFDIRSAQQDALALTG